MHMDGVYDMLYLLLIPRECTPCNADLSSIIAVPVVHANQATTAQVDIVKLTKGFCSVQNSEHGSLCK